MGFDDRVNYMLDNMDRIVKKIISKFPSLDNSTISHNPQYILFHTNKALRSWYGENFVSNKTGLQPIEMVPDNFTRVYSDRFFFHIKIQYENDGTYMIMLDDLSSINPQFSYTLSALHTNENRSQKIDEYLQKTLEPFYNKVMYL